MSSEFCCKQSKEDVKCNDKMCFKSFLYIALCKLLGGGGGGGGDISRGNKNKTTAKYVVGK